MRFWQCLLLNREVIDMIANIAVALGMLVSAFVIIWNIRSLRLQKMSIQAALFHNISSEITLIVKEQKSAEIKGDEHIENWYELLLGKLEYFAFFANRKLISKDMSDYYISTVITYCDAATTYPELKKELKSRKGKEFCELERYYEKHTGKKLPF